MTAITSIEADDEPATRRMKSINILLAYASFGLQLCSVVGSSVTCIQLLAGGFDPVATSAISLLLREFEMLFLTVQICFSAGLVAFLMTIITRESHSNTHCTETVACLATFWQSDV